MRPTRAWLVVALFAVAGVVAYLLLDRYHSLLPTLSIDGPIAIVVLALADGYAAWGTRARLAGRPGTKPIAPITVARLAALGKASALVGAPLAGFYAGVLGRVVQLDSATARTDLRNAAIGVGCAVLLGAAGLALENVGRVKHPPPSDET